MGGGSGPKRKRSDGPLPDMGRPSPHRPAETALGQHDRDDSGRGRRRGQHRGDRNGGRRDASVNHRQPPSSPAARQSAATTSTPTPMPPPQAAAPNTTPQPRPAPAAPIAPPPKREPPPRPAYRYDNLTDDAISAWQAQARADTIKHGAQSRDDYDITELSSLFQEFIHAVMDGRLQPRDAGGCVKEILGDQPEMIKDSYSLAPHTLFLDSLATVQESDPDRFDPAVSQVREFLIATEIDASLMREVLEVSLLTQLGLLRDVFPRLAVKHATNLLYRQNNYNLLREETEGYSKLISEVYTTCQSGSPDPMVAERAFERIKALIGTFDLDVGRVLDVTLDVAASVLIKQYQFFVRLFRISSWWPRPQFPTASDTYVGGLPMWAQPGYPTWTLSEADEELVAGRKLARDVAFWDRVRDVHINAFFELGGRQATEADLQNWQANETDAKSDDIISFQKRWISETKTLPPLGNRVAAQLLGFKLKYYISDFRDKDIQLPANLLYLAALLIKIGFLSITDLYPHLWPSDDDMEAEREKLTKKLEEEEREAGGGPANALLAAGVLPQGEDDNPAAGSRARLQIKQVEAAPQKTDQVSETKEKEQSPIEQKVSLVTNLIRIGALPEVLFFLGRFPWVPEVSPDVLAGLHRILNYSINKVYQASKPKTFGPSLQIPRKHMAAADQSGVPKGQVRVVETWRKKMLRFPFLDQFDMKHNEAQDYRFYWEEWCDNVPQCQNVDDVFALCNTLMNLSGVMIGKDEALLAKLTAIGAKDLDENDSSENKSRWLELLKRMLVPALSHTKSSASLVNAIWKLLKRYPLTTRYNLYAEWFEGQISRLPAMRSAFAKATSETRGTMKRVSKENIPEMARRLAKISYSSPGVVFKVAFEQLEAYPNLIDAFVGCAEYFTDMSYDVLVWSLMNSLGKSRSRTQSEHALTTSKWLQALSRFSGKVFRKYLALDPTPVLKYVNDQLHQGNSTDLIILKEFITSMGGIVDNLDFTDQQVLAMAGGPHLQRTTLIAARDLRFDNIKSSKRLIQALVDSKLAARLLINLAQYRQAAIFQVPEEEAHIKYLSSTVDDSHQALVRYLDFLWSNLDPSTYEELVPSVGKLITDFGLDAGLAFLIGRPLLAHEMYPWSPKKSSQDKENEKTETDKEGDVAMEDTKPASGTTDTPEPPSTEQKSEDHSLIRTTLQPIINTVQESMSPELWQKISPDLYVTFWALQLGDLYNPVEAYTAERKKLKDQEIALSRDPNANRMGGRQRNLEARHEIAKKQIPFAEESSEHKMRVTKWKLTLMKQFQGCFPEPRPKTTVVADVLLEQCFLPRAVLSPTDAEYTFHFIKALHNWNAPGFKLMDFYDRFLNANRLRTLIFTSTVREAENLGRFLKLILQDLSRWHKNIPDRGSKDQPALGPYDKEGKGLIEQPRLGFALTYDEDGKPQTFVEHMAFKDLLFGWHKNLNLAIKACLHDTEWMHIRNAITVLKCVLDVFPAIDFMAKGFKSQLEVIAEREQASKTASEDGEHNRVDLSVAAQGAMSELQRRKANWVMVQAFRTNAVSTLTTTSSSIMQTVIPDDTQTSTAEDKKGLSLRATASEFKPSLNRPSTNDEDEGEIQDGRGPRINSLRFSTPSQTAANSLPAKPSHGGRGDTPKRDATPSGPSGRSSTPKPNGRSDGRVVGLPERPPHSSLPSRPEVSAAPSHYNQSRGSERRDGRESRDSRSRDSREHGQRDERGGREEPRRNPRDNWPRDPERSGEHGRDQSDRGKTNEPADPNKVELGPRHGARGARDRDASKDRHQQASGSSSAADPPMNPARAALFSEDTPERASRADRMVQSQRSGASGDGTLVNPERAALMGDSGDNNTPTRGPRDERGGRRRGNSPRRGISPGGRNRGNSPHNGARQDTRTAEQQHQPTEERTSKIIPPKQWVPPEQRDAQQHQANNTPHQYDNRSGRLNDTRGDSGRRDASFSHGRGGHGAQQSENYGRLNPGPVAETPSGPRGRGRGSRNVSGMQQPQQLPHAPRPLEQQSRPADDRAPPTGPASSRGGGRKGYGDLQTPETPSNALGHGTPTGPATHPDRMRNVSAQNTPNQPAHHTPVPVHPDRMGHVNNRMQQSPNGPGQAAQHMQNRQASYTTRTPDRGAAGMHPPAAPAAASGPSTPGGAVPTGPSSSADRRGRGAAPRNQLLNIQNFMDSNSSANANRDTSSNRNRPRQMLEAGSDVQVLTGGPPAAAPSQDRRDPARSESSQRSGGQNGDEAAGSSRGEDRGYRDSSRSERSGRSRRSSRERGSEKDRDGRDREHRDRRSGVHDAERESSRRREGGGHQERDLMGPPSTSTPRGDANFQPRDSSRHGGDDRSSGRSGRSGRSGEDRKNDDGRSSRKRRSEEGSGLLQHNDHRGEKRPRR